MESSVEKQANEEQGPPQGRRFLTPPQICWNHPVRWCLRNLLTSPKHPTQPVPAAPVASFLRAATSSGFQGRGRGGVGMQIPAPTRERPLVPHLSYPSTFIKRTLTKCVLGRRGCLHLHHHHMEWLGSKANTPAGVHVEADVCRTPGLAGAT